MKRVLFSIVLGLIAMVGYAQELRVSGSPRLAMRR